MERDRGKTARIAVAGLLLGAACAAEASPYLYSEGQLHYRGTVGFTDATQAWDTQGDLQDIGCRSERNTFTNQLEYGQSYWYTLFGGLNYSDTRCGARSRRGLGDLNVGIRGRIDPYKNYRAWELDLTIPFQRRRVGETQVGCGVYGLGASADRLDVINERLSATAGAGVNFWQAPAAHQFNVKGGLQGPLGELHYTQWSWVTNLTYEMPLNDRPVDPVAAINDCGTQARVLRAAALVNFRYNRRVTFSCGYHAAVWGEDASRGSGFSCAYARLWDN